MRGKRGNQGVTARLSPRPGSGRCAISPRADAERHAAKVTVAESRSSPRWPRPDNRLRSHCGVKLGVIVEVIFDDQIALARGLRESRDVEDADFSAGVFDKSFSLESRGCGRDSRTATPKHVCEKLMRNLEGAGVRAVRAE